MGGNVEQLRVFTAAFNAVVRPREGFLIIMRDVFVEFGVLLVSDIGFTACPKCAGLIDSLEFIADHHLFFLFIPFFFLHANGECDVIGIFTDYRTQLPGGQKFIFAFTQMQGDTGATLFLGDGFDGEFTFTCRFPAHALIGGQAGAAGFDGDLVGDDEAGIKTDAKLTDQCRVFLLIAGESREKFFGA